MPDPAVAPHALVPITPAERNITIDVIRGFALLGILTVNIDFFAHPIQRVLFPIDPQTGAADRVVDWCVRFFAEGKFYSLFSFLFGLGFGLQLLRSKEQGARIGPVYARRLGILFLIGLVHLLFIWAGDILTFYAVAGFALLLFRNAKPRTLVIWIVVLLALPMALNILATGAVVGGRMVSPEVAAQIDKALADQDSEYRSQLARAEETYAHGTFAEITEQRGRDGRFILLGYFAMGPQILAMFLIGLSFARRGVFSDVDAHRALFRKLLVWGIPLAIAGNGVYATIIQDVPRIEPSVELLIGMLGYGIGTPALCLVYASGATLLLRLPAWRKRLQPLAAAGRIPLSNYLAQSVICTFVFYSYGLGLFGRPGRIEETLVAFVVYPVLVVLSVWWTSRRQYGPLEWLWRKGTYGRSFPVIPHPAALH
jgi:uncharacterized protein